MANENTTVQPYIRGDYSLNVYYRSSLNLGSKILSEHVLFTSCTLDEVVRAANNFCYSKGVSFWGFDIIDVDYSL